MKLKITINGILIRHTITKFSDGAISVKFDNGHLPVTPEKARILILSNGNLNDEFFIIASAVDILRSINPRISINLFMPYTPYARQDRRMVRHDAFSLKIFADMMNSLELDSITVMDSHSGVAPALLNNCTNISQEEIFKSEKVLDSVKGWAEVVVAPDAGASKKAIKVSEALGLDPNNLVYLEKVRDVSTGSITSTKILNSDTSVSGRSCLIVDDLCDGGATFISAANALYDRGATHVGLFVTHGLFSRGVQNLTDNGIDRIWTTDSFINEESASNKNVVVFSCSDIIRNFFYPYGGF